MSEGRKLFFKRPAGRHGALVAGALYLGIRLLGYLALILKIAGLPFVLQTCLRSLDGRVDRFAIGFGRSGIGLCWPIDGERIEIAFFS